MSHETRDVDGFVLCCHGRPIHCLECGEDYAAELNTPPVVDAALSAERAACELLEQAAAEVVDAQADMDDARPDFTQAQLMRLQQAMVTLAEAIKARGERPTREGA
jgi:hypothetical protein